jgi:hypothetical protein
MRDDFPESQDPNLDKQRRRAQHKHRADGDGHRSNRAETDDEWAHADPVYRSGPECNEVTIARILSSADQALQNVCGSLRLSIGRVGRSRSKLGEGSFVPYAGQRMLRGGFSGSDQGLASRKRLVATRSSVNSVEGS